MIEYTLAIIFGFVIGWLWYDFSLFRKHRAAAKKEAENLSVDHTSKVYLENHDDVFFAYSDENQFLGQSSSLEELALKVLGERPSVLFVSEEDWIIFELKRVVSEAKNRMSRETSQEH